MSEQTITTITEELSIEDFFTEGTYSPYGVIQVVNKILKAAEVDKVLPGPMGYTYCKKGYIKTIEGSDQKKVTRSAAIEWAEKYITKMATK
jgi:hypothetical protein